MTPVEIILSQPPKSSDKEARNKWEKKFQDRLDDNLLNWHEKTLSDDSFEAMHARCMKAILPGLMAFQKDEILNRDADTHLAIVIGYTMSELLIQTLMHSTMSNDDAADFIEHYSRILGTLRSTILTCGEQRN